MEICKPEIQFVAFLHVASSRALPFLYNQFPPKLWFPWMRQSCVHERPAFEFLSALVTVGCGGVCWISLPLVSITYFKLLSLKARLPNRQRDMRVLVNWRPCLPSVRFPDARPPKKGVSSPSDMYFFLFPLTKPFLCGRWFNPWGSLVIS